MKKFYTSRLPSISTMSKSPKRRFKDKIDYLKLREKFKNVAKGPRLFKSFVKETTINHDLRKEYFKDDEHVVNTYISRNLQNDI